MARGPLPSKKKRRTNAPTIPTTELPAEGRKGRPPKAPEAYNLQKAGKAWWRWAWSTPQAAAWNPGDLYVIARRASLEDDLAMQDSAFGASDFADMLGRDEDELTRELEFIVGRLSSMAGGRNPVIKEMRELDKVLGLTPKGLSDLRWEIVDSAAKAEPPAPVAPSATADRKARLALVKTG